MIELMDRDFEAEASKVLASSSGWSCSEFVTAGELDDVPLHDGGARRGKGFP